MDLSKRADFLVLAKKYDDQNKRIIKIRVCRSRHPFDEINPCLIEDGIAIWDRKEAINYINDNPPNDNRVPLLTCPKNKETGHHKEGEEVFVYTREGDYFIRTKGNKTEDDNLEELPEIDEDE